VNKFISITLIIIVTLNIAGCDMRSKGYDAVTGPISDTSVKGSTVLEADDFEVPKDSPSSPLPDAEPGKASALEDSSIPSNDENSTTPKLPELPNNPPTAETDIPAAPPANGDSNTPKIKTPAKIDFDLTSMDAAEVYSQVCDMVMNPLSYDGKTVKLTGEFSVFHSETENKHYFSVAVYDPAMKNKQEITFELMGGNNPGDCPATGTNITVSGTFRSYTVNEFLYFELAYADIVG